MKPPLELNFYTYLAVFKRVEVSLVMLGWQIHSFVSNLTRVKVRVCRLADFVGER